MGGKGMWKYATILVVTIVFGISSSTWSWGGSLKRATSPKPPDTRPRSSTVFQFTGGVMFGGSVTWDGGNLETDPGQSLGMGIEFPSPSWLASGLDLDLHQVRYERLHASKTTWVAGVSFRRALKKGVVGAVVRPGFAIGYGQVFSPPYLPGNVGMFIIRGFLELDMVSRDHLGVSTEMGFVAVPYGKVTGVAGSSFSANLRPLFRVGLLLK
jgi:hypothetical protein